MTEPELRNHLMGEGDDSSFQTNWLVEAGAGAGKTYTIVRRIVNQLRSGHCRPEEVVAITFTNKSTNELRERVTRALREARDAAQDEVDRQRLDGLYHQVEAMQISTIHGFCQTLLTEMPLQAGLGLDARVMDEEESSAYEREFFRESYRAHPAWFAPLEEHGLSWRLAEGAFREGMRHSGVELQGISMGSPAYDALCGELIREAESLRAQLHRHFDAQPHPLRGSWLREALAADAITTVREALMWNARMDRLWRRSGKPCKVLSGGTRPDGRADTRKYDLQGLVAEDPSVLDAWKGYLDAAKQLRELRKALEKERQKKRQTDLVQAFIRDLEAQSRRAQTELEQWEQEPACRMVSAAIAFLQSCEGSDGLSKAAGRVCHALILETVRRCLAAAEAEKAERSLLSYDDLLCRTRDLLRDDRQARSRFRSRYRVLYVDEFQDTDPVQAQILFYLTTPEEDFSADWTKCRPRPGSLFLVGDPKQSIYRFRGADLNIYNQVHQLFEEEQTRSGGCAIAVLRQNFRSTRRICADVTATFRPLLTGRDGQAAFTEMEAAGAGAGQSDVGFRSFVSEGDAQCAAQIAAFIEQAVRDGKARFGDFLVLTPRRKDANLYREALCRRAIPTELSGQHFLGDTVPIRRAAEWCDLLLHSGDDVALYQVLHGCFGAEPEGLYALQQQTGKSLRQLRYMSAEELEALRAQAAPAEQLLLDAFAVVERVTGLARSLPPVALLEELFWGDYGLWPGGTRDGDDYGWVCQYLEKLRSLPRQTFQSVLRAAVSLAESQMERALPLDAGEDRVRVMNLHKAKGLESRIVILTSYSVRHRAPMSHIQEEKGWFAARETNFFPDGSSCAIHAMPPDWDRLEQLEEAAHRAEAERVRYVAATRAKELLLVCRLPNGADGEPKDTDFWRSIQALPLKREDAPLGCSTAPLFDPDGVTPKLTAVCPVLPDGAWDRALKAAVTALPPSGDLAITPSGLDHPAPPAGGEEDGASAAEAGLSAPEPREEAPASEGPFHPYGPDWGTIVHRTLELLVNRGDYGEESRLSCAARAVRETLPPEVPLTAAQRRYLANGEPIAPEALAEDLSRAAAAATAFLDRPDSPLRDVLGRGTPWTELPFYLHVPDRTDPLYAHITAHLKMGSIPPETLDVQGVIDLAVQTPEGWLVVDYKTDRLRPGESEAAYRQRLRAEYAPQIRAYTLVLERLGMGAAGEAWLCSIPLGGALIPLFSEDDPPQYQGEEQNDEKEREQGMGQNTSDVWTLTDFPQIESWTKTRAVKLEIYKNGVLDKCMKADNCKAKATATYLRTFQMLQDYLKEEPDWTNWLSDYLLRQGPNYAVRTEMEMTGEPKRYARWNKAPYSHLPELYVYTSLNSRREYTEKSPASTLVGRIHLMAKALKAERPDLELKLYTETVSGANVGQKAPSSGANQSADGDEEGDGASGTESCELELNTILYGPPGTGKTYHTRYYAVAIARDEPLEKVLKEPYEDICNEYQALEKDGRVHMVTFHQSYGYEEFVQGIRPVMEGEKGDSGELRYEVRSGSFVAFCNQAREHQEQHYIFIIDEINRGNISRIFGELITLIEKSKREGGSEPLKVHLPYNNETFCVPANVYLLGTMNTADRSLALLDTALRRRFAFRFMAPDPTCLRGMEVQDAKGEKLELDELLEKLNERLELALDREHTLGHAYFLDVQTMDMLADVMEQKVIPLLQEFFYEEDSMLAWVLGKQIIRAKPANTRLAQSMPGRRSSQTPLLYTVDRAALRRVSAYQSILGKADPESSADE